ncbi:MAG TPA: ArgE/DapE family deacylase [bacterium]|nr:ArgE/DapE family deacylase [bacterium]
MKIKEAVGENLKEAVDFLCSAIKIKSVSGEGEEEIQAFIKDKFAPLGTVSLVGIPDGIKKDPQYTFADKELDYSRRKNIVLDYPSSGKGKSLILNSHSDVVPAESWKDAFSPGARDNFIFGRGAVDAKGQVATIYLVLLALKKLGVRLKGSLSAQVVIEEEVGGNGSLSLIRQGYRADGVIVLEPTRLKITPANRGAVWFKLEIEGRSVHMGKIREGVNAIEKTCLVMKKMKEYEKVLVEESRNIPLFEKFEQPVQVNFGTISGSGWPAMVCGNTFLEGGVGFLPNKSMDIVKKELEDVIRNCGDQWVKEHYRLSFNKIHNDAYSIPPGHPLVEALKLSSERTGNLCEVEGFIVSCDARLFNRVGNMPVVVFGPGRIEDAHSNSEKIDAGEIRKAAEVLTETVLQWCGQEN